MISPNMILQGKQPEDFQHAKGQSDKEPSKGIFGAILNALQNNDDEGGKNLLSGMNSGEGESEGENENEKKKLLTLSALSNRLVEAEAKVDSEPTDENSADAVNNLETEREASAEPEAENVTEEPGQLSENSTDESVISKGEVSDKNVVQPNSADKASEGEGKNVEGSDRREVSENNLNPVNLNAESEKSDTLPSTSELQSENAGNSLTANEVEDGNQNRVESAENRKSDSSVLQDQKTGENQVAGLANSVNSESSYNGIKNIAVSEEKIASGSNGLKSQQVDERIPLQSRGLSEQSKDSVNNRTGEQPFPKNSEQAGRMAQDQELKEDKSSGIPRDISAGQILQSGSAAMSETGIAGAAVNSKSINIDRLREEKEKKMSARILNSSLSGDQTRSRNSSENGSSKSLFPFSGGQDFGNLNVSSDEGSMEESVLFWNRFGYEGSESVDDNKSNGFHFGLSRLSQIPIMNTTVRQQLLNGIAQSVQTSTGSGKTAETWQKHTFSLENGKNVQISVRQVEGVLHLKLGSTNIELTKLLQMNQQEIKDHLQNEFDIEVDLEFSQNDEGNSSEWFDAMQRQTSTNRGYQASSGGVQGNVTEAQTVGKTVRNFGYNQMEWTA